MKKLILMLVCMAWIGNNAVLLAAPCASSSSKNQHACCTTKMETCKATTCTMSHEKVKSTDVVVFSEVPSYAVIFIGLFTLDSALVETKKLYSLNLSHSNDAVPIPIYLQNHTFLI